MLSPGSNAKVSNAKPNTPGESNLAPLSIKKFEENYGTEPAAPMMMQSIDTNDMICLR